MKPFTFITGNQKKADYLAKYLGLPVAHEKIDLEEIQSLDLQQIVEHKLRQAYAALGKPVLVEDTSLVFCALGRLPGTFIKFFIEELSMEKVCTLLDGKERSAIAQCVYGYYDGKIMKFFAGKLDGKIAETPAGENGFGWDKIFIPNGYTVTRACLSVEDDRQTYLQIKPLEDVRAFLFSH